MSTTNTRPSNKDNIDPESTKHLYNFGPTLYKCYTDAFCSMGRRVMAKTSDELLYCFTSSPSVM